MLIELRIRDFAIIDRLELRLPPGFLVLTGETGAGKSIIVDAVELVLGERADTTVVRSGAERTLVEAVFRLAPEQRAEIDPVLEREGVEGDAPDFLLLGREVRLNKRNICRVNGRTVTLSLLREVTENLVDIHGQSEHLSLLRTREHLNLLDRYADLGAQREQVAELVREIHQVRKELKSLRRDERELAQRADLLQFQLEEIDAAALEEGEEEEELRRERPRLANAERLTELTNEVNFALEEGDRRTPSALDLLGSALRALTEAARVDPGLEPLLQDAEELNYRLEDLGRRLRDYQDQIEYSPERLQEVEERLALIRRLERKYGDSIADVLAHADQIRLELENITHSEERTVALEGEDARLLKELGERAIELSQRRREASECLSRHVERELSDLSMDGARFGVAFDWREAADGLLLPEAVASLEFQASDQVVEQSESLALAPGAKVAFDASGIDQVEFLVAPNPGEPLKPMTKIASGGETSRLMLALKTVLSRADETPTLVFDEIDQGIGGRVGAVVGEKLWGLAAGAGAGGLQHQVLCVTHLPQLAGFADTHFRVAKRVKQTESGERTVTLVEALDGGERVEELAQMLGGGEAVLRSAEELLEQVARRKRQE